MKNMTLGAYLPYDSFMHRIDPRAKISALMVMLIAVFFDAGFLGYAIIGAMTLLALKLAKIKIKFILKSIKPMMFMMAFLGVLNIFMLRTGEVLVTIGNFPIYTIAITQTVYIIIRLVLIVAQTTTVTATTKPLDLTLGIEHLLTPFKKIGFPAHEVAMMISIALRFIPTLLEETQRIMKAQASRGVDLDEGTLMEKIKAMISLIIPLFVSAFQRAIDLADAMEARGYIPDRKRTRYHQLKMGLHDFLMLLTCAGVLACAIFLHLM